MAAPEAVARSMARGTRKLEMIAERQGNEDGLFAFHRKVNEPTYGDAVAAQANAINAAADLIADSLGIEIEEEELDEGAQIRKYNAQNPSEPFVGGPVAAPGQPIPEDAEVGAAMSDAQAEGSEAASSQSEEEREALTAHEAERDAPAATPSAVKKADELGVDLAEVQGSGSGGKILVPDVEAYAERQEAEAEQSDEDQGEANDEGQAG